MFVLPKETRFSFQHVRSSLVNFFIQLMIIRLTIFQLIIFQLIGFQILIIELVIIQFSLSLKIVVTFCERDVYAPQNVCQLFFTLKITLFYFVLF